MVSDDLRRQADEFIDLVSIQGRIGRDMNERTQRDFSGPGQNQGGSRGEPRGNPNQMPAFLERRPAPVKGLEPDDESD